MISSGAIICVLCLAGVALMLYIGLPHTNTGPRCKCGLVDLTGRREYSHPSRTHRRWECR